MAEPCVLADDQLCYNKRWREKEKDELPGANPTARQTKIVHVVNSSSKNCLNADKLNLSGIRDQAARSLFKYAISELVTYPVQSSNAIQEWFKKMVTRASALMQTDVKGGENCRIADTTLIKNAKCLSSTS